MSLLKWMGQYFKANHEFKFLLAIFFSLPHSQGLSALQARKKLRRSTQRSTRCSDLLVVQALLLWILKLERACEDRRPTCLRRPPEDIIQ